MAPIPNPDREVTIFSKDEERRMSEKTTLDSTDRQILALILVNPKMSNSDIGEEIGMDRIQVWRRRTKGPLAVVLMDFQKEAIHSAADLTINAARGAIERLDQLARGECDCPRMIREQSDNHRQICLTPVPYAVQRQAAKDLVEILQHRRPEENEQEEEVWESVVSEVGGIRTRKRIPGVIDVPAEGEQVET